MPICSTGRRFVSAAPRTRRRRWIAVAAVIGFGAAGCGGSERSDDLVVQTTSTTADDPQHDPTAGVATTPTEPPASTIAPVDSPADAGDGSAPTVVGNDPVSAAERPFPAPALPIAQVFEFAQPIWSPLPHDDGLLLAAEAEVLRLDVDTGAVTELLLVEATEFRVDPVFLTRAGPNIVVMAVSRGYSNMDLAITVDPDALERTGSISVPLGEWLIPIAGTGASAESGETKMLAMRNFEARRPIEVFDTESTTMLGEAPPTLYPNSLIERIDDELWVWNIDGQGRVLPADGSNELAVLNASRPLGAYAASVPVVDPDSVWLTSDPEAVLMRFDRTSYQMTGEVDLSDRYGPDAAVSLLGGYRTDRFVLVQVQTPEAGWYLLVEIDPGSGHVRSEHVIATTSLEYGWTASDRPSVATIGERVFVRYHLRRIVEVDVDRLGDNTGPWLDPDLSPRPELTDEEQEIAQLMLDVIDPETPVDSTDPELGELTAAVLSGFPEASQTGWEAQSVVVAGDRAWGRVRLAASTADLPLAFTRVDGWWLFESIGLCYVVRDFGIDACDLQS